MTPKQAEIKIRSAVKFAKAQGWRIIKNDTFLQTETQTCMCPIMALVLQGRAPGARERTIQKWPKGEIGIWKSAAKILGVRPECVFSFLNGFDSFDFIKRSLKDDADIQAFHRLGAKFRRDLRPRSVTVLLAL